MGWASGESRVGSSQDLKGARSRAQSAGFCLVAQQHVDAGKKLQQIGSPFACSTAADKHWLTNRRGKGVSSLGKMVVVDLIRTGRKGMCSLTMVPRGIE